jgi:ferritin
LRYRKNNQRLFAVPLKEGGMKYILRIDGKEIDRNGSEGQKLMADAVKEMISLGFDADDRMQRICEKGGLRALLKELNSIDGDFVKSKYLNYVLSSDSVLPEEMTEVAEAVRKQIGSDYEKRKLLENFSAEDLSDSLVSRAYFEAVESIGSDFDKTNVLRKNLDQPLTKTQTLDALGVINSIGSDDNKGKLLSSFSADKLTDSVLCLAYIQSVKSIGSDFEKTNVLKKYIGKSLTKAQTLEALDAIITVESDDNKGKLLQYFSADNLTDSLSSQMYFTAVNSIGSDLGKSNTLKKYLSLPITDMQVRSVLDVVNTMGADNDKVDILRKLIDKQRVSGECFENLLFAVNRVGSDFEKGNLIKMLIKKDTNTEGQWIGLINETKEVSSEFDRSNILIQIAQNMPKSEEALANYKQAAKTINSEHDYNRVIRALE